MRLLEFGCLVAVLCGLVVSVKAEIYIITAEGEPVTSYRGGIDGFEATVVESDEKIDTNSELVTSYAHHLEKKHDMLLGMLFEPGTFKKLYSYRHLINGFAVHIFPEQVRAIDFSSCFWVSGSRI
ncbi:subtilisin-like protease SBT2.6 [Arachis ipaensis]|uniref:subtilisin-like protease SBT2.6 n=1 Tax=Arachis ipaensis TaxID=130454 RepID=UPI000A2B1629|nr:subtilisin-like protease SBT2.6 [Arachis ipaensis]